MTESFQLATHEFDNAELLEELAWTIQAYQEEFALIFVSCNYTDVRQELVKQLKKISPVTISELDLKGLEEHKSLYKAIQEKLEHELEQPAALMVFGLEKVENLSQLLKKTNYSREEFRKHLPFPLMLWINDEVRQQLKESALDFYSWGTSINFKITTEQLLKKLASAQEQLFTELLKPDERSFVTDREIFGESSYRELQLAERELVERNYRPSPELEASINFACGRNNYTCNRTQEALSKFQKSLDFWKANGSIDKQALVLFHIGLCYVHSENWSEAREAFENSLKFFEQLERPDLVAKFINQQGRVLLKLEDWRALEELARKFLKLQRDHSLHNNVHSLRRQIQAYGFLAEIALHKAEKQCEENQLQEAIKKWQEAQEITEKTLGTEEDLGLIRMLPQEQQKPESYHRLLLARAQCMLGQLNDAQDNLIIAKEKLYELKKSGIKIEPQLFVEIVEELQQIYSENKQYLEAFKTKKEKYSIQQEYGLKAFIGASRLQPLQVLSSTTIESEQLKRQVAREIEASDRQKDIKALIDRLKEPGHKLTVVYGPSGVGKSSLLEAGLVVTLEEKEKVIGGRRVKPIFVRDYSNWKNNLEQWKNELKKADATSFQQLKLKHQNDNLLLVFIFDQFEEFFSTYEQPSDRQNFFKFLQECLSTLSVNMILSLREDYLHLLLESDRKTPLSGSFNLLKIKEVDVFYYVGNFSRKEAKSIIETLNDNSNLGLSSELIDKVVTDLSHSFGEVKPIELQVVGAQLEAENIKTLSDYWALSNDRKKEPKEKLIEKYLEEVVNDCGKENKDIAEWILYFLTDEKTRRPRKTQEQLENDLKNFSKQYSAKVEAIELVLDIFSESGLVSLSSESTLKRYQLVHDYLADLIRFQRKKDYDEKIRRQENKALIEKIGFWSSLTIAIGIALVGAWIWRQNTAIAMELDGLKAWKKFESAQLDSLLVAMHKARQLQSNPLSSGYSANTLTQVLQNMLDRIQEEKQFKVSEDPVSSVSLSPDGKQLAISTADGLTRIENLENLSPKSERWLLDPQTPYQPAARPAQAHGVSFSPNGRQVATASDDGYIRLWNLENPSKPSQKFSVTSEPNSTVSALGVSFSPDGKQLVTISDDKIVRLWNLQDISKPISFNVKVMSYSVIFDPKSFNSEKPLLVTADVNGYINWWTLGGKLEKQFLAHNREVRSLSFSESGNLLVTGSSDGTTNLWRKPYKQLLDGKTLTPSLTLKNSTGEVYGVSMTQDGQRLASGSSQGVVSLWNLKTKELDSSPSINSPIKSVSIDPSGEKLRIAIASSDGTVRLWQPKDKKDKENENGKLDLLKPSNEQMQPVTSVNFHNNGQFLAAGLEDGTIKVWKLQKNGSWKALNPPTQEQNYTYVVNSVSFHPEKPLLATASQDGTVRLWNLENNQIELKTSCQCQEKWPFLSVKFSPKGNHLVTGSSGGTIRQWDWKGKNCQPLGNPLGQSHALAVLSISFNPKNENQLFAALNDGTVYQWDLKTKTSQPLKTYQNIVRSVTVSPDGNYLATASDENTVLWDLKKDYKNFTKTEPIAEFVNQQPVFDLSFSHNGKYGKYLVTASADGTAKLWNVPSEELDEKFERGCIWLRYYLIAHSEEKNLKDLKQACDKSTQKKE